MNFVNRFLTIAGVFAVRDFQELAILILNFSVRF
jgi:hypothetical protein